MNDAEGNRCRGFDRTCYRSLQVKSTGWWNDVTVTKIPKIEFSEKLIKHTIRELPTLVSESKKSYIESNDPKFAGRPRAVMTSVTF